VIARPRPLGAADCLSLAAAPTFAVMALVTAVGGGGPLAMLCGADTSPLTGMIPMYLLMSAFHTVPWLRLLAASAPLPAESRSRQMSSPPRSGGEEGTHCEAMGR
jgi:hypothetical protein